MSWRKFAIFCSSITLIFVAACSPQTEPGGTTLDATAASQTQAAGMKAVTYAVQTALANVAATRTAEFTLTASLTPTPSHTSTATFTLTPTIPMVSVSSLTNCRSGPGAAYEILGGLKVGETAEVVGRGASNDFWIIKLPSNPAITCWLWGQYASVTGNTAGMAVFNPPPTPTPRFTATPEALFEVSFVSTEDCGGSVWGIKFKITNTGSVTWESNRVIATDQTTSETRTIDQNTFPEYADTGCAVISEAMNLEPGESGYTSSNDFSANPAGHDFTATIRICSKDGMLGTCEEKTITFTP
jgi:hypothetical protein